MSKQKKIGRYIIKGLLGEGAMGSVFRGHDPNLERDVAIKTMRTGNIKKKDEYVEFKNRFFLESRANGRLNHPNIVSVYDSGLEEDQPYMVMEYIQGKALDAFIDDRYENRLDYYITLLEQIASGLDYAHEEGVIHRDVKPGNILVSAKGPKRIRVKIVDFGLAKLKDSKLTATGYFLGTPSYSSPEQVMGGKLDIGSDLFSFGTVAYELLTGSLPFDGESLHSILYKIANEAPNLSFDIFADFLDVHALSEVFKTIFQKNPEKRFESAGEFTFELKSLTAPLRNLKIPKNLRQKRTESRFGSKRAPANGKSRAEAKTLLQDADVSESQKRMIEEVRQQFKQALRTKNLSSVQYCLQELKRLEADVTQETSQYEKLADELKKLELEKNRTLLIRKGRSDFELALKTKNIQSVRYCLAELERIGADIEKESAQLKELEETLRAEAEGKKEAKEKATKIKLLRAEFAEHIESKDLSSCGHLIEALVDLGANVKKENAHLSRVEKKVKEAEKQRKTWILKTRKQFKLAVEQKNKDRCSKLMTELESLLKVDVSEEKKAFNLLLEEEKQKREREEKEQKIRETLGSFNESLKQKNVKKCSGLLKQLEILGRDVAQEAKALSLVQKQHEKEEAEKLKERMIVHTRDAFRKALIKKNLEGCRYYLKELRQLVPNVQSEERALASLETMIGDEQASHLKESMILKLRDQFQTAFKKRNFENCLYYLKELQQLKVDVKTEKRDTEKLKKILEAEAELQENMILQSREKFQTAIEEKDLEQSEHFLNVLNGLGADIKGEKIILAELKKGLKPTLKEEEKLKAKMVRQFRAQFKKALQSKNVETCQYYLKELDQLEVDTAKEAGQLEKLLP